MAAEREGTSEGGSRRDPSLQNRLTVALAVKRGVAPWHSGSSWLPESMDYLCGAAAIDNSSELLGFNCSDLFRTPRRS